MPQLPPAQGTGMRHGQPGRMGTGNASPSPCATQVPHWPQPKLGLMNFVLRALAAPLTCWATEPGWQHHGCLGRAGTQLAP